MSPRVTYHVMVQVTDKGFLDMARFLGREPYTDFDEAERQFEEELKVTERPSRYASGATKVQLTKRTYEVCRTAVVLGDIA